MDLNVKNIMFFFPIVQTDPESYSIVMILYDVVQYPTDSISYLLPKSESFHLSTIHILILGYISLRNTIKLYFSCDPPSLAYQSTYMLYQLVQL